MSADCYVGLRSCGCMVAWVSFQSPRQELERAVSEFVRDGLRVESRVTEEVRQTFGDTCERCDPAKYQAELFAEAKP